VRRALDWFDSDHRGFGSDLIGEFSAQALREQAGHARNLPWIVSTDVTIAGATASCAGFPYPVSDIGGQIEVRDGYVNILGVRGRHGPGSVHVDGRIGFNREGTRFSPALKLTAQNVPIDAQLLAALPSTVRKPLEKIGPTGQLDAAGQISGPWPGYDLDLAISDGALSPRGKRLADDLRGHIRATPGRIETTELTARRGDAALSAHGWLDMNAPGRAGHVWAQASNLALDDALHDLLPEGGRSAWEQLQPSGTADVDFQYDSANSAAPMTLTLQPRQMSAAPRLAPSAQPLHLQNLAGSAIVIPGAEARWDITAGDRQGRLATTGSWRLDDRSAPCDIHLSATNLLADAELIRSLPPGLSQVIQSLHLSGAVGFEFSKLSYRPATQPASAATSAAGPDADFSVKLDCDKGSLFIGVPLEDVIGTTTLTGSVRGGVLRELSGELHADSLQIAGRQATNLSGKILKPADEPTLYLKGLHAAVAGGDVAGDLAVGLTDNGAGRYAMRLAINGADVSRLSGPADATANMVGKISASLDLAGNVNDPSAQRGRGAVQVSGAQLYQLPLVLGLFQITNLALPINSPFEQASSSYIVQGRRVTIERVSLSGKDLAIQGNGHLDFNTMQVELNFTSPSARWLNVPLVGPMWNGAQNELLRIHVKGSVHAPTVSASSFDTFTTTVDEVFKGK
jgi:hypothetical protein